MSAATPRELHVEVERGAIENAELRGEVERKRAELSALRRRVGGYEPLELRFVRVATVAALLLTVLEVLVALSVERSITKPFSLSASSTHLSVTGSVPEPSAVRSNGVPGIPPTGKVTPRFPPPGPAPMVGEPAATR